MYDGGRRGGEDFQPDGMMKIISARTTCAANNNNTNIPERVGKRSSEATFAEPLSLTLSFSFSLVHPSTELRNSNLFFVGITHIII
jgi:hypothetical protein